MRRKQSTTLLCLENVNMANRTERANLLGYDTFSKFKLDVEMASNPEKVHDRLMAVWKPAKKAANNDAQVLTKMMLADNIDEELTPADWLYYSEKRRAAEHNLNEAEL